MKLIHTFIFTIALIISLSAQDPNEELYREDNESEQRENMESRMESQKVAFITQKLELTPSEAQQFWPLYNEYQSKTKELRQQNKMELKKDDINEKDANAFLESLFSSEQKELDIKKEYFNKLKSAVSAKKVAKLYILEKKFREEILANIRSRIEKKKRKNLRGND